MSEHGGRGGGQPLGVGRGSLGGGGGSGGKNQKWPTYGQSGYVTPCRLGDPHRFRAGGQIRSGPLVGKVAMSPLPSQGSPPLRSGGENQKWPTCGQSGYVTPAVSGIPTASERGGKSEVAHLWAKWLRHPCRLGDPHRCRAGGGNQKWPTCGQSGYVTPAVSGIPTAAERGAKSEVAHLWAKWLRHPCRLGDPHRFRAGGKIRSGPLVGKVATSPLPSRGSPPLQSGGQNQKWPTSGQSGYVTPAVSGIPTASERGEKSEVAHLWAKWLCHPCRLRDPHRSEAGGEIRSGPLVGKVAMSTLPSRGSPPLQSGEQNQKWPTSGQSGYVTPAVSGIPTASERGGKSEVAHLWAKWLRHPCHLGDPHRFRAGGKIRSGPLVGKVATSPLPSRGSPPLESGGENKKWPTSGQSGYVTPAVSGIPTASERGGKSEVAHLWAKWLRHPCRLGDPHRFRAGGEIRSGPLVGKVATSPLPSRGSPPLQSGGQNQKWPTSGQSGYVTPAVSGIPTAAERGGEIRSGPQVGKVATSPLPSRGSPPLQSGGENQKWPTCGQSGYVTPCRLGDPHRCRAGGGNQKWPTYGQSGYVTPCRLGDPHRCRAGGGNQKWPTSGQSGYVTPAVSGIPTASERGGNQKWPTCGQSGYVTPAVSGIPTASERGGKSEVAHLWAKWLRRPCRLGDPHRFRAGGKIRSGPLVGKVAMSPLPSRGSPPLQSGGGNQKWPTSGQSGYVTPAVSGIPTASERGGKSEVAHLWAKWLCHPLPSRGSPPLQSGGGEIRSGPPMGKVAMSPPAVSGIPTAAERGGEIRSGPQVGKVATSPLPSRGSPPLQSGGEIRSGPLVGKVATSLLPSRGSPPLQSGGGNQKWPTCGQSGYVAPAVSGIPTASERGAKSEVAHLWAKWLCHPCRLGDPHRCRAGGGNQKWPTSGQSGYVTPAVSGIPTASERGGKIRSGPLVGKVAMSPPAVSGIPTAAERGGGNQKWPTYGQSGYVTPCRLGDPHRCRAGGGIRSGPQVGKVATSPLPSRGSPPLQSGGGNQKWPTCGQSGYVTPAVSGIPTASERGINQKWPTCGQSGYATPAVSGIPTASERGGKSEVAHKWAKWLRHPCRLGDPHRFKAGGGKSEVAHLWAKWLRHPCRLGIPTASERGGKSVGHF